MVEQQEPDATSSEFSARLIATDGTSYELSGKQTLGRSQDVDITISDPKISRSHAHFCVTGQQLTVEDLGSKNGTRVNQRRIEGTVILCDGDIVNFDTVDLTVALTGVIDDDDATVVASADDVTVVGSFADAESAPEPKPTPAPAPETPPQASRAAAPQPAEPEPPAKIAAQAEASSVDLPGSWVDEPAGEFTRILSLEDAAAEAGAEMNVECASDLPHLIISTESVSWVMELDPATGDEVDVWEIGRAESCQIVIADDSISSTHCQLIHQNGRWRLVNLVSTNGIYVNGKKSLKAYLADGDQIKLGMATLIFKVGSGAAGTTASDRSANGTGGKLLLRFALAAGTAAVAVGLWWFFS
jgi:pSer/pThr/pTyr-binding forkhead associated (FHA) protein